MFSPQPALCAPGQGANFPGQPAQGVPAMVELLESMYYESMGMTPQPVNPGFIPGKGHFSASEVTEELQKLKEDRAAGKAKAAAEQAAGQTPGRASASSAPWVANPA
eukprot:15449989-Alexandrium_andersonii.AAC.1